jgi:uncharacterized membrane protein
MAITKIIGYILSVIGLAGIAFSNKFSQMLSFLGDKSLIYTIIASIVLIIVGIALVLSEGSFSSSRVKQAEAEVPIYEGEGKKRKIVGYQRAK